MRLYAERPGRATRQVIIDLAVVAWIVGWVWLAMDIKPAVLQWRGPGWQMIDAGGGLRQTFRDAANTAEGVPFVGKDLANVLLSGEGAGDVLSAAGRGQIQVVDYAAIIIPVLLVLFAFLPVLTLWLPRRCRYVRTATSAMLMRSEATELLALRALNELPYRKLRKLGTDPAVGWRAGDPEIINRLAEIQLARLGLRAPAREPGTAYASISG